MGLKGSDDLLIILIGFFPPSYCIVVRFYLASRHFTILTEEKGAGGKKLNNEYF